MPREPCKYIDVCTKKGHASGICNVPSASDTCEFRPDREIDRLQREVDHLKTDIACKHEMLLDQLGKTIGHFFNS